MHTDPVPPAYQPFAADLSQGPSAPPTSVPMAPQSEPGTTVSLHVSCTSLLNRDAFSKSDPQLLVYIQQRSPHLAHRSSTAFSVASAHPVFDLDEQMRPRMTGGWTLIHRSRTIKDDLNPVFPDAIQVDYRFERVQNLCVIIVDVDDETKPVEQQDFLGHHVVSLAGVVASGSEGYKANLDGGSCPEGLPMFRRVSRAAGKEGKAGQVLIRAGAKASDVAMIVLSLEDDGGLSRPLLGGSVDAYVVVSTVDGYGKAAPLVKTADCKAPKRGKGANARWIVKVPLTLAGGLDARLRFSVWDHNASKSDKLLGECEGKLSDLGSRRDVLGMLYAKGKEIKAQLVVESYEVVREETFIDHVARGCVFSLAVAIDFTGSNGDPRQPTSLHFMPGFGQKNAAAPYGMNEYQRAIVGVGKVLAEYDHDQKFPTMGFGFQMAGASMDCAVLGESHGVDGILRCYHDTLNAPGFQLWGPTLFAPVIRTATNAIRQELAADRTHTRQRPTNYHILLILTDGQINDMDATRTAIVEASSLPLSIIIVGVGREDFSSMKILDGDNHRLTAPGGRIAERDCVQFVAFAECEGDPFKVAAETLAEIPTQFMDYTKGGPPSPAYGGGFPPEKSGFAKR
ncbi:hypothetical protein HK101_000636 [Irineochytrium annulatum]|nr:hypothetical protein HK101_000636 [Irineochytrium annulatum]